MHFIHSDSKNHIGISIWLLILSIMAFLMIVIGGLTRLTGSGLSMVDRNPIMGTIPPLSHLAWVDAFDNYKIQIGINNILDEKYQQAHEYSTMGRTFNFGLRRVY